MQVRIIRRLMGLFKAGIKLALIGDIMEKNYISGLLIEFLFLQIQANRVIVRSNAWINTLTSIFWGT